MCHCRILNNRIKNIHHKALRTVFRDKNSNFEELLEKGKFVSDHSKNLQYLTVEIFKVKNSLFPIIMNDVFDFQENECYNLRSGIHLANRNIFNLFAVKVNRRVFGKRKVDIIQDNFLTSAQRKLNLIKCWLMNTLKNVYRNSASHS